MGIQRVAVFLGLLGSIFAAHAQDCVPVTSARGPVTQQMAQCAIGHAQFLYLRECGNRVACNESQELIAAYRTAASLYDRANRAMPEGSYNERMMAEVRTSERRGFLAERSHRFDAAVRDYKFCTGTALQTNPVYTEYSDYCASDLMRLQCAAEGGALCNAPQTVQEAVNYITVSEGGGRASSALDSFNGPRENPAPPPRKSTPVSIHLPAAADVKALRGSMTAEERNALAWALAQEKVTIAPR